MFVSKKKSLLIVARKSSKVGGKSAEMLSLKPSAMSEGKTKNVFPESFAVRRRDYREYLTLCFHLC